MNCQSETPRDEFVAELLPVSAPDLAERLRAGDQSAYEELVRVHGPRLLAVARRLLRSEEDARDAVQDAFFSAFRSIERFEGGCQLSTWLHQIVVNAALMKIRSRKRRGENSIEDLLPKFSDDGHRIVPEADWDGRGAEVAIERREVRLAVRRAIDRLPEAYRTVLMLRDIEELDTAETAERLGVSENAVKVRLHRARQALRTLLAPVMSGGEAGRSDDRSQKPAA